MNMKCVHIHPYDNVAVAVTDIPAGETLTVAESTFTTKAVIPFGHKVALSSIRNGEMVIRYGFPIGHATADIDPGDWVHTHNVFTNLEGVLDYNYTPVENRFQPIDDGLIFDGFIRANNEIGIRNEVWIIPTVGCVNKLAEQLAWTMNAELDLTGTLGGVHAFTHPYGCSQLGADERRTQNVLANLVKHPNAGAVLVLSLGCEQNNLKEFQPILGNVDPQRVRFLVAQDCENEVEVGLKVLRQLVQYAGQFQREPVSVSRLKIGMKCGGSDGFSGMTANPLVGSVSDAVVARGGTSVLTEVPEMFGAETLLFNRCVDEEIFEKSVRMVNGFKEYYISYNQPIYENPAPGNRTGGITTLEEKSLGCIQKGGSSPVVDVLEYGERLQTPGLNLLSGPGNDGVSVTGLTAAGAHLVLFTTGRGNPLGSPVPTVKISSNSPLAVRKPHWIDFDAGRLLHGSTMPELTEELLKYILDVASGRQTTCNERNGYREIIILKDGVTV